MEQASLIFEGRLSNEGERIVLSRRDGSIADAVTYRLGFPWPTVGDPAGNGQSGTGRSIQLVNPTFDNDLAGNWRSAQATPGTRNSGVFTDNAPPLIRQVKHAPQQPASDQTVLITAKVTDSDGLDQVTLLHQVVEPGDYISISASRYETGWAFTPMHDDGLNGDTEAGDDIYSVQLGGEVQRHRRLIRYRVFLFDRAARFLTVPYTDDPQPNFAYFVYDGVPAWTGAIRPGTDEPITFDEGVMRSLPTYHLISKRSDIEASTWRERYPGSAYRWEGALVYDGQVYDHIRYRARGGVWRYAMGKNMWKFDFNRGHQFQARDDYGRPYRAQWDKLNLSACIQQGNFQHRGEQGLFEAATFGMFNLTGVEAPLTHWLQFRIISEAQEVGPNQYTGDFWGLYLALEQMDGKFLDEHDLPDGNLYKIEGYQGDLNNKGWMGPTDRSDVNRFTSGYGSRPEEQWWRDNVDLERYYAYRAVLEGTHHGDVGYGKNYFFYFNPRTQLTSQLPWDVDLTWANNMYGNGEDPFKGRGAIFSHPALLIEYNNRLREFRDLFYNGDQAFQYLDELAAVIDDPDGGPSIVDADRAQWDYNPIMANSSGFVHSNKGGQGRFYQRAATQDFPGMVQLMKDYVLSDRREFNSYREDPDIPATPRVRYLGPAGYPLNELVFETSSFADPQGKRSFAAMKWRIAAVEPWSISAAVSGPVDDATETVLIAADPADLASQEVVHGRPWHYEIQSLWESEPNPIFEPEVRIPAGVVAPNQTYRVRCAFQDSSGRWSHWSEPVQFSASHATDLGVAHDLKISEIMYNPAGPPAGDARDNDDFEFIELHNSGPELLDLSSVSFTDGIRFEFKTGQIQSLGPGEFVLIVKNISAFESRYGTALMARVAGAYAGKLSNGGETIRFVHFWTGTLAEFAYDDKWHDLTDGGGFSLTLVDVNNDDPDSLGAGQAWRPSRSAGGSPGYAD